jgi:hypothetical protein
MPFRATSVLLTSLFLIGAITAFGQFGAASWIVGYVLPADNNYVPVSSGGQIQFPPTSTDTTATAAVVISNIGQGTGGVKSISVNGTNFQPTGLPIFPYAVPSGKQLTFGIVYSPAKSLAQTGTLDVEFTDGVVFHLQLVGSIAPSALKVTYSIQGIGNVLVVDTGGTIVFPSTPANSTTTAIINIGNLGPGAGNVNSISIAGNDFKLLGVGLLPVTLAVNRALQFSIAYTPSAGGTSTGALSIGVDNATLTIGLAATSAGASFAYSSVNGSDVSPLTVGQSLSFPDTALGQASTMTVQVTNTGNANGLITNLDVNGPGFQITNAPILPLTLPPNASAAVDIAFTPTKSGSATGYLQIGSASFGLGASVASIPGVRIVSPAGPVGPLQQPAIGLALDGPYPAPLSGTLTLTVNPAGTTVDPAVQFATGGRSVAFTFPAGSTTAQFPAGPTIGVQTGTVASTIRLSATLATKTGIDITPDAPPATSLEIRAAAPQVVDVSVVSQTANGFTISVTGFSTTRSANQLALDFAPKNGYSLPTGSFTFDIRSGANVWYQSAASQTYGSLFTVTVPFTYPDTESSWTPNLIFQSIAATLTNDIGQSNKLTIAP